MSGQTIRDVVIRVAIEQVGNVNQGGGAGSQVDDQNQYRTATEAAAQAIYQEEMALRHAAEAHEKHGHGAHVSMRAMAGLVHGVEHLIHATIELSAANEEDAEKMMRKFMQYDAYFKMVTAGIHIIHGLEVAEHMLSMAFVESAVAGAAAMAPLIAIGAIVAGTVGALDFYFDAFGRHAKEAREQMAAFQEADNKTRIESAQHQTEERGTEMKMGDEEARIEALTNQLSLRQQIAQANKIWAQDELRIADIEKQSEATLERRRDLNNEYQETFQKLQEIDQRTPYEMKGVSETEQEREELKEKLKEIEGQINAEEHAGLELEKQKDAVLEHLYKQEEHRYELLEKQNAALEEQLKKNRDAVAEAAKALTLENDKVDALNLQMGHLTKAEQIEAETLAKRIASGKATDAEYRRAEQLLPKELIGDIANKHFEDKGTAATERIGKILGVDVHKGEDVAQSQLNNAMATGQGGGDLAGNEGQILGKIGENHKKLQAVGKALEKAFDNYAKHHREVLEPLIRRVEKHDEQIKEMAAHGKG